jgi:hypothetical protein
MRHTCNNPAFVVAKEGSKTVLVSVRIKTATTDGRVSEIAMIALKASHSPQNIPEPDRSYLEGTSLVRSC